jgi:hypothetical protein
LVLPAQAVNEVGDLAKRIRTSPEAEVFDVCAKAIERGADHKVLLTAAFVAGIHDIRPRPVGSKLHAVMTVESAFQMADAGSKRDAYHAALWGVHDFKRYQQRDRELGDWVLPERPKISNLGDSAAREEFQGAMEAWDAERADRAIVSLLGRTPANQVFELLWPFAARSFVDVGHKIIFGAQVERVLRRVGWRHAEPALRSLVNGLAYPGRDNRPDTAGFEDLVVTALQQGLGPATIWDGLRLFASEIFLRRPPPSMRQHLPVHPVTEINAFVYAWRTTTDQTTKRLLILQAAGWLPLWKPVLTKRSGSLADRSGIDALGQSEHKPCMSIDDTFEQRSPDATRVCLDNDARHSNDYLSRLRAFLFRKAWQDHQYKYLAAIHEESRLVDSRWASRILAPAITYLPTGKDPDSEVSRRSMHALRTGGVL